MSEFGTDHGQHPALTGVIREPIWYWPWRVAPAGPVGARYVSEFGTGHGQHPALTEVIRDFLLPSSHVLRMIQPYLMFH